MLNTWLLKDKTSRSQIWKFLQLIRPQLPELDINISSLKIGDHLLFFNSLQTTRLDRDGYFTHQTPSSLLNRSELLYTRRLWVQGHITNHNSSIPLDIDGQCIETIKFVKKKNKDTFVCINRNILMPSVSNKPFITELRTLLYTNTEPSDGKTRLISSNTPSSSKKIGTFRFKREDIISYSYLTSNPHRIHLDSQYSQEIEGYKDIIVQGPFSLQVMLKFADVYFKGTATSIRNVKYKHSSPIYPETKVDILLLDNAEGKYKLWMVPVDSLDKTYLSAEIEVITNTSGPLLL
ncbi:hydroxyacyl-thioester dehydratase HTD2 NDAI_0C02020 [Naumovozyma dairenensis CBS 421]|uniref:MaoC-like domain-containing protein n=1 Tax=Naumovozyma dairenensis (strain ATCC 10597 / BCRC 20456 / CBS 421 / NBRC 0211 / NRRL Y-12639) TaxID=1071378 RepID=G0W7V1_NAUDC|nr:hypothetical protein NDAI_0C02020 [Naumovozyma dairenensis CBS 421]CCD23862.1 hypothetical protein NDAI_0C02020 [Naumovozyma dairenensis CBS 421]